MKKSNFKLMLFGLIFIFMSGSLFAQTARLQIIHNSADALVDEVDIFVNGVAFETDFGFRTATPFLDVPAGVDLDIVVAPAGAGIGNGVGPITVNLASDETYIAIANGIVSASGYDPAPSFSLDVYPMGREQAGEPNETDVLAFHGSTDAPTVSVWETAVVNGEIIGDFFYGDYAGYLELATLDYVLDVRNAAGDVTVATYAAPLSTLELEGEALVVVASGFLNPAENSDGPAFGLFVALAAGGDLIPLPLVEEEDEFARLQIIHNSADALVDEVDIFVNGDLFLEEVGFRQATPFMDVPAGVDLDIVVAPAGAGIGNGVGPLTVNLTADETYIAIASGIVSASGYDPAAPFTLEVFAGAREAAVEDDEVDILVFHGVTDAPSVNVGARFVGTLVTGAEYTDFAGYLSVPATYYTLDIAANAAPDDVIVSFGADLRGLAGSSVSVLASGFLNPANNSDGAGFALIAVLADGTVVELPVVQEFEGTLGGLVEVPANLSNGSGSVGVTLAGDVLQLAGSFSGLTGTYTMSHIHRGAAGINGGVAFGLTADAGNGEWSAFENIFDLTSTDIDELNNGELYVNLHTDEFPAGEVRAQILASPNNAPSASEITAPADGAEITLTGTPDTPFVPSWSVATDPDGDNVVYVWQLAADSEFNTMIVNASTGADAQFETDFGTVDALLDDAGVNIGDEITLYHRAISTDGSEVTIGTAASVVITRGFVGDFARLQIIHNSADALVDEVDIFVNGDLFLEDVGFRQATPFMDVPAGVDLDLVIAPAGAGIDNGVGPITVNFDADETYVVVAAGNVSDTGYDPVEPFALYVYDMGREEASDPDNTDVLAFHGSTDAPTVSVWETGVGAGEIISDFNFGDFAGYLELATADYILEVRNAAGDITVAAYDAPLSTLDLDGEALVVVASGFLNPADNSDGPAFGLFVALAAGGDLVELPLIEEDPEPVIVDFPFFEDFEDADTYGNWIIIDGSGEGFVWQIDDTDNFNVQLPMEGSFANIDSDAAGSGNDVWSILQAPIIDLANFTGGALTLSFDHHYRHLGSSVANVLVSNDGETWETVASYTSTQGESTGFSGPFDVTPVSEMIVLDGFTSDDSLYVRFEYNDGGSWAWYWLVDNIEVNEGPEMARLQIIHNSADALVEEVDIFVNGDLFLEEVGFRQATPFMDVPAGVDLNLVVAPAGAGIDNGVGPITVNFDAGETYVVVAAGNVSDSGYEPVVPFGLFVYDMGREEASNPDNTDLLAFHGSTDAPTVSVWETAVVEDEIIGDLSFGEFAGYLELITDDYIVEIRDASGETTVAAFEMPLEGFDLQGEALVAVASGFLNPADNSDGPAFGLWVALPSGGAMIELTPVEEEDDFARLQIIHNSADALVEEVDIFVNGDLFLEEVGFRQATPFMDVPAGVDLDLVIAPAGAGIDNGVGPITVNFDADETYIVVAAGNVSDTGYDPVEPFGLFVYPMGREEATDPDNTDVLAFHGSTDAPTVSVWETGMGAGEIISDFSFGDFAGYLELGTADYILEIRDATGEVTVAAYQAPLASLELDGEALTVLASGFLNPADNSDGPAFGLFVALAAGGDLISLPLVEEEEDEFARLQIIHNSADALVEQVDIFVNGDLFLEDVGFRQATPFMDVPAGVDLDLVIAPAGAGIDNGVGPITVNFDANETYVVVAAGNVSDTGYDPVEPFGLFVYPMGREEATDPGNTDVLAFHGSTDAPTVSIWETGVGAGEIISDFAFGDFAGYLELGTADYILEVRDAAGEVTVAAYEAPLAALELDGEALVVVASGFLDPENNSDGPAFGLFVALAAGGDLVELPLYDPTSVQDLSQDIDMLLFPNPARDVLNITSSEEMRELRVINTLGKVVYATSLNSNQYQLNVGGYDMGIYFVQVLTANGSTTQRVQITR